MILAVMFSIAGMYIAQLNNSPEPVGVGISLGSIVFTTYISWMVSENG